MNGQLSAAFVLATTFGLAAGPALADIDFAEAERLRADGAVLPTAKIAELAVAVRAGTVADLELERVLGRYVYEVEVRDADGQEWNLDIDAKTGEILQSERDD